MSGQTEFEENIRKLRKALDDAEAVVIGAGAGLSTSAGFIYAGERFDRYFSDFAQKYGFRDMYSGGFYDYPDAGTRWAFWSRNIWVNRYMDPPKHVYENLYSLVQDKDYFVITTNVDHCFQKAGFDKKRLFYTQGDYGLFQCSKPCHQKTYDNKETVRKMILAQGYMITDTNELIVEPGKEIRMTVPEELIPVCPVCGEPMAMNLRADDTFVQDAGWDDAAGRYTDFLKKHQDAKVLFLELGVGFNTPGIIKIPFIRMTDARKHAVYACLNLRDAYVPDLIADKSICINADIGDVIASLQTGA